MTSTISGNLYPCKYEHYFECLFEFSADTHLILICQSHCRLRYQGSYLPMVLRSPERLTKVEDDIKLEEPEEKKVKYDSKVKLDNYKFAFEKVPSNTGWYNAFRRLDNTEQSYAFFSNCKSLFK